MGRLGLHSHHPTLRRRKNAQRPIVPHLHLLLSLPLPLHLHQPALLRQHEQGQHSRFLKDKGSDRADDDDKQDCKCEEQSFDGMMFYVFMAWKLIMG